MLKRRVDKYRNSQKKEKKKKAGERINERGGIASKFSKEA